MGFRFLHAADLHLDTPFAGASAAAASDEAAALLRDASLLAFDDLVRLAIARGVDAVILAGDVYDGAERGVRAQLRVQRGLRRLSEQGIRTFMAAGNHDPVDEGWSAVREWPELVTVFPAGEVASVPVERDGRRLATVHGISFGRRAVTENLAVRFAPDGPGPHVAVLHANVGGQPGHDPYSPCNLDDLLDRGVDYWALGHVHTRQVLHRDPWVVYPGNLQGRSPRRSERGAKGVLIVEIDDTGRVAEPEHVALDRVRFDEVEIPIDGLPDLGAVCDALGEAGSRALVAADGRSLVLRACLVGIGPAHADLRRPGALADLVRTLRDDAPAGIPFLWWDRVDVATGAPRDLDALRTRNDFVADLLETHASTDDEDRAAVATTWSEGLPADLPGLLGEAWPDPADADRWVAARDLAVDLVAGEED